MTCFYPVDAWRSQRVNESGKRGIVFRRADGFSDMPLQVPCGRCDGCRADRAQEWAIRIYHEASQHERNCFLTLTYADPAPPVLDKKHLQDFFKRARHDYSFRYFACGEYGSATHRPHYHAVFFGQDFLDGAFDISDSLYSHPVLQEHWGHGQISIGSVTMASCCYVAGYVNKKVGDTDTFSLMSRRPGIGHDWLDKYSDDIARTGFVTIEGRQLPVPRRYFDWKEDDLHDVKLERAARFSAMTPDERFKRYSSLPAREKHKKAQLRDRSSTI